MLAMRLAENEAAWRLQIDMWQNGDVLKQNTPQVSAVPHSPEHQQIHTKMVKQVLKDVARQNQFPYPTVFKEFIDGNTPSCTQCFWENFYRLFPDPPYHYVAFCHDCRRFDLYETEAAMLSDGPVW